MKKFLKIKHVCGPLKDLSFGKEYPVIDVLFSDSWRPLYVIVDDVGLKRTVPQLDSLALSGGDWELIEKRPDNTPTTPPKPVTYTHQEIITNALKACGIAVLEKGDFIEVPAPRDEDIDVVNFWFKADGSFDFLDTDPA